MTWKGISLVVHLANKTYRKGISLIGEEKKKYEFFLDRSFTFKIEPI